MLLERMGPTPEPLLAACASPLGKGLFDGDGRGRFEWLGSVAGCDDDGSGRFVDVDADADAGEAVRSAVGECATDVRDRPLSESPEVEIGGSVKPDDGDGDAPMPRNGGIWRCGWVESMGSPPDPGRSG